MLTRTMAVATVCCVPVLALTMTHAATEDDLGSGTHAWSGPAPGVGQAQSAVPPVSSVREELVGEISKGTSPADVSFAFSRDTRRVAWTEERGKRFSKKWAVVVNGQSHPEYGGLASIRFSPDGQRLAYAARAGKSWLYVVDGAEGPAGDDLSTADFSPDGRRLAYAIKRDKLWTMTIDGEPVGPEPRPPCKEALMGPRFSPDGQRLAFYRYSPQTGTAVVADGKDGPFFDQVFGLVFSSDGRRLAYAGARFAKSKYHGTVVIDAQDGPVFEGGPAMVLTVDLPLAPQKFPALFFEGGQFQKIQPGAFAQWLGVREVDREFGPKGMGVSAPVFSPDGRTVVHAARRGVTDEVVVTNGEAHGRFATILTLPVFSPDGRHVAYLALDEKGGVFEVVDGQKQRAVPFGEKDNFAEQVAFSPDGVHLAYVLGDCDPRQFIFAIGKNAWRRVVLDGAEGKKYYSSAVTNLRFSPDGLHLAFEVHEPRELRKDRSYVVLDGQDGKPYHQLLPGSLFFSGPAEITYLARQDRAIYRVIQRVQ
jgi:dipeptidyl aminopeptidase/acylaminoacyl peptidase